MIKYIYQQRCMQLGDYASVQLPGMTEPQPARLGAYDANIDAFRFDFLCCRSHGRTGECVIGRWAPRWGSRRYWETHMLGVLTAVRVDEEMAVAS